MKKQTTENYQVDSANGEKWVRNAAMLNFGPIIHAIFLKSPENKQTV